MGALPPNPRYVAENESLLRFLTGSGVATFFKTGYLVRKNKIACFYDDDITQIVTP